MPIWPTVLSFSKEIMSHATVHKFRLLPTLRCLTTLAEKIGQTSALEDRRMRRDVHEAFVKLVDATVQASGRSGTGLSQPSANMSASTAGMLSPAAGQNQPNGQSTEKLEDSLISEKGGFKQRDSAPEVCAGLGDALK